MTDYVRSFNNENLNNLLIDVTNYKHYTFVRNQNLYTGYVTQPKDPLVVNEADL